jgi:protein gp37
MSGTTKIQWTDMVWNPVTGCDRTSPGCDHCYALTQAARQQLMERARIDKGIQSKPPRWWRDGDPRTSGPGFGVACHEESLEVPLHWKRPRRIFVNSMSDLFHPEVPDEFIGRVFATMALAGNHTFQVLTKRAQRMASLVPAIGERLHELVDGAVAYTEHPLGYPGWPLPNVWLGVSVENPNYKFRLDHLRRTDAAVRFVSFEPLLADLGDLELTGIDWAIAGGESGRAARPCDVQWVRSIVEQCRAASVPVFVKQLGRRPGFKLEDEERHGNPMPSFHHYDEAAGLYIKAMDDSHGGDPDEWPEDLRVREMPEEAA